MMRTFKKIILGMIIFLCAIVGLISYGFHVNDMTLSKGEVKSFDEGWSLRIGDVEQSIDSFPYIGESQANEVVIMKNNVPREYFGQTIFFLSADKNVVVRMDGEEIYSFGRDNEYLFGRTPGSIVNFVDIPLMGDGDIEIEMVSPYPNYATYLAPIRVANRDVAILQVLKENMFNLFCSVIMLFCGILLLALGILQKKFRNSSGGATIMGALMIGASFYYAIETKILHIWYGNQNVYSFFVFAFLMCMPIMLITYYMEAEDCWKKRKYQILLGLGYGNMIVQLLLQLTDIVDLINMAFVSHFLILISIVMVILGFLVKFKESSKKELKQRYFLEVLALLIICIGNGIDMLRNYTIKIGDFGKYSRYSFTVYGIILVVLSMRRIIHSISIEDRVNQTNLEKEVEEKTKALRDAQKKTTDILWETISALSNMVDAKDRYTSGHSKRVAEYSRMLARHMGLSEKEQEDIYMAGLLHDVGKIRIPDDIINKPGSLTDEEFNYIKLHPVTGYHILKGISNSASIAIGAKYHHERYDGKGYPNGLKGTNIPQIARIIGVADAYDAMASNRSYRNALPQDVVRGEIVKGRGTQFDPEVADCMLKLIDSDTGYRMRQTDSLNKTILVVDDEPMNVKIVERILKDEPMYTVLHAYNGQEALDLMEDIRVDLILLDIEMPGMNGFEVVEHLKNRENITVVFMSADRELDTIERAASLGVSDYLTKPFMPIELKEIVHCLIEG